MPRAIAQVVEGLKRPGANVVLVEVYP